MVKKKKISAGDRTFHIAVLVIVLLMCVITLYPIYYMLIVSISDGNAVLRGDITILPKGINFGAYKAVLSNEYVPKAYLNTLIYTVAGTLVTEQAPTIQLVVSKGPMLVKMPDIIGWTQNNASKKLDESGINYSMQIIENDGQYAENCVVKCDVSKGTKFDADETVVTVYIAGARNDAFAVDSSPTPSEQPNWADSTDPAATAAP